MVILCDLGMLELPFLLWCRPFVRGLRPVRFPFGRASALTGGHHVFHLVQKLSTEPSFGGTKPNLLELVDICWLLSLASYCEADVAHRVHFGHADLERRLY